MLRLVVAFVAGGVLCPFGHAQQSALWQDWELDARGGATVIIAPGRDDAGTVGAEIFLTDLRAELRLERVLDNGAEIGVRFGGRVQLDHPQRSGFSGLLGEAGRPIDGLEPRGAFTGLTLGGAAEDSGVRAAFETAFAYIDGGYGELLVGRDIGAARRFHEGAESVLRRHTVVNPALDTSGIASVLTRSDLSGPSAKLSYATPRILGLRLGVSYAPEANIRGLDRDPGRTVAGVDEPRLENITEAAFNLSRRLRTSGVRLSLYGAYARADVETGPMRVDNGTVEVWSTGGRIERDGLSFGADWLTTDNGGGGVGPGGVARAGGRYDAWSVSLGAEAWGFDWSATFGQSDDDLLQTEGRAGSVAVSKQFYDKIRLGFGLQTQVLQRADAGDLRSTGPVIEMSLNF